MSGSSGCVEGRVAARVAEPWPSPNPPLPPPGVTKQWPDCDVRFLHFQGEDFRIDAISNDLDDLLTKDPAGELKARSSLCQNPSQLRQFLSSHGPRVLVLKKSDCQPVVRTLVQIAKGFATEDEDVLDLLRFLRRACAPPTTPGIARECRAFADWCQKRGVVGADGEKALRGLRKAAEAAADELRAAPRPAVAVNEGLRRKLLANTYVCTSERDLARHFPQVRRGVQSGEVGDYVDVLCTALARKTQSLTAPATPLFRDVHEFVCQTYAASDAAPPDEVRAFMERLKREPRPVPGAQRKRARAEAVPRGAQERAGDKAAPPAAKKGRAAAVPQRAGDKAAPPAGKKGRAAAVPPAARPTERRSKVRKAAGARAGAGPAGCDPQAATLRKVAAAKRKEVRPVPAPTQMYWAEGSLDLRKIVKWSMRKKVYDDIFEI